MPEGGFLRHAETGSVLHSPFMHGIVTFIFLGGLLAGLAYGIGAGTFKSDADVVNGMKESMESLGLFMVLVFFAAQFVAYFKYTNLGHDLRHQGRGAPEGLGPGADTADARFLLLAAVLNLCMGSASAKWAFMAPVFIPMFMLLGYTPELVQGVYRIGDSSTNLISPMMSFFALIVAFVQRYDPKAGIGTVIATMLPYSVAFLLAWMLLLASGCCWGCRSAPAPGSTCRARAYVSYGSFPVVFLYWIVSKSRGFSVVVVEQTSESFPPDQQAICSVIVGRMDQRTPSWTRPSRLNSTSRIGSG